MHRPGPLPGRPWAPERGGGRAARVLRRFLRRDLAVGRRAARVGHGPGAPRFPTHLEGADSGVLLPGPLRNSHRASFPPRGAAAPLNGLTRSLKGVPARRQRCHISLQSQRKVAVSESPDPYTEKTTASHGAGAGRGTGSPPPSVVGMSPGCGGRRGARAARSAARSARDSCCVLRL